MTDPRRPIYTSGNWSIRQDPAGEYHLAHDLVGSGIDGLSLEELDELATLLADLGRHLADD